MYLSSIIFPLFAKHILSPPLSPSHCLTNPVSSCLPLYSLFPSLPSFAPITLPFPPFLPSKNTPFLSFYRLLLYSSSFSSFPSSSYTLAYATLFLLLLVSPICHPYTTLSPPLPPSFPFLILLLFFLFLLLLFLFFLLLFPSPPHLCVTILPYTVVPNVPRYPSLIPPLWPASNPVFTIDSLGAVGPLNAHQGGSQIGLITCSHSRYLLVC